MNRKDLIGRLRAERVSTLGLAARATNTLRRMITEGEFSPWEPLVEARLAEILGVSRTPVREAIAQLQQEGLVRNIAGKGAFVVEFTYDDFREINDLRFVLEPMAAESAMATLSKEEIQHEKSRWCDFSLQLERDGEIAPEALTDADDHLHHLFIDHCANSRLRSFLNVLRCQISRYVYDNWATNFYVKETIDQHLSIIENMENGDIQGLQESLRAHISFNSQIYVKVSSQRELRGGRKPGTRSSI